MGQHNVLAVLCTVFYSCAAFAHVSQLDIIPRRLHKTAPIQRVRLCEDNKRGAKVSGDPPRFGYYEGMLRSKLDARAGEKLDNLTPNLKLVGGAMLFCVVLVALFLAAN